MATIIPSGPTTSVERVAGLDQADPSIAVRPDGTYVVAYLVTEGITQGAYARLYDRDGTALSGPLLVQAGAVSRVEVAGGAGGQFAVAVQSNANGGDVSVVRYLADGGRGGATTISATAAFEALYGLGFQADGTMVVLHGRGTDGARSLLTDMVRGDGTLATDDRVVPGAPATVAAEASLSNATGYIGFTEAATGLGYVQVVGSTVAATPVGTPTANHRQADVQIVEVGSGQYGTSNTTPVAVWRDVDPFGASALHARSLTAGGTERILGGASDGPVALASIYGSGFLTADKSASGLTLRAFGLDLVGIAEPATLPGRNNLITAVDLAFHPDGRFVAVWGQDDGLNNGPQGDAVLVQPGVISNVTLGSGPGTYANPSPLADVVIGGDAGETFYTLGDDTVMGGGGDDTIYAGRGAQRVDAGAGYDTVVLSALAGTLVYPSDAPTAADRLVRSGDTLYITHWVSRDVDIFANVEATAIEFGGLVPRLPQIQPLNSLPEFDGLSYVASYADLTASYGPASLAGDFAAVSAAGARHYAMSGRLQGRDVTFDGTDYLGNYADLRAAFGTDAVAATRHFLVAGVAEHRLGQGGLAYVASYDDLIATIGANREAGASHYALSGQAEGRVVRFDAAQYLANYADLRAAFGTDTEAATQHYILAGHAEHRLASDPIAYVAAYRDLIGAFARDPVTDTAQTEAQIAEAGRMHYEQTGWREGREAEFSGLTYLLHNYDVRQVYGDDAHRAALHFVTAGLAEGRAGDVWA